MGDSQGGGKGDTFVRCDGEVGREVYGLVGEAFSVREDVLWWDRRLVLR